MNLLWYWLLEPFRGGISDTPDRQPAINRRLHTPDGASIDVSLYLDPNGLPMFVKVRALDVIDDQDAARFLETIDVARHHMLTILKMTWSPTAQYSQFCFSAREGDDGRGVDFRMQMEGQDVFDATSAEALYEHTLPYRDEVRLLVDGSDTAIPIQYRFLSLYKFLELRFQNEDSHWDFEALEALCAPHLEAFGALNTGRTLRAELMHLRDRCAHIMTGTGKKRRIGVSALQPRALREVTSLMPLLAEMCRSVFNSRLEGRVALNTPIAWNGQYAFLEDGAVRQDANLPANEVAALNRGGAAPF